MHSYVVSLGDSVFEIARKFNITPETLLWANYDLLNDNPDMISVDMELKIPPVDGVYYQWVEGDSIQSVAARFEADVEDILSWSGNGIDLTEPSVPAGCLGDGARRASRVPPMGDPGDPARASRGIQRVVWGGRLYGQL